MKLSAEWLSLPSTRQMMDVFATAGIGAYFVGGCVRNALIGAPASDIDISTAARPEVVIEIAERAGLQVVQTGTSHGTVTVIVDRTPFEITTFRKDVETDGRRAVVAFSDRLEDDARRRDFTMNAIYADAEGRVVDPLGGLQDLRARKVRFIDDPEMRIREDYLRILRFFRFYAWYGDPSEGPDPEALAACASLASGLDVISKERLGSEMVKLLSAADPAPAIGAMESTGVLSHLIPAPDSKTLFLFLHGERACDPIARLAALAGASWFEIGAVLRLSTSQTKRITRLREAAEQTWGAGEVGYRLGEADGQAALGLRCALFEQAYAPELDAEIAKGAGATFPVSARDIMPTFEGPALGAALKRLEKIWIDSGFEADKRFLLSKLSGGVA